MGGTNPKVDEFISKSPKWQEELERLRSIVLASGLTEELKWRQPCYSFQGSNIAILGGFKEYCALSFFKGALLKDPQSVLDAPGENTQSARLIRFTSVEEVAAMEPIVKAYIEEAIEVETAGLKVDFKETSEYSMPEELRTKFGENPAFKAAFEALTPGRQRGYLLHFSQPKQSKTREARIEKNIQRILDGKGLQDR
jgi:uncharacterized protein YdeI (YjbR/CyaY-like superfamily)